MSGKPGQAHRRSPCLLRADGRRDQGRFHARTNCPGRTAVITVVTVVVSFVVVIATSWSRANFSFPWVTSGRQ